MTIDEVMDALGVSGTHGKALCPSHDDDKASLSVTRTDEDKILVKCHAGCDQIEVLRGLEAEYGIVSRDLGNGGVQQRRVVARYVYKDAGGQPVFTKTRFEPKEFVIEPSGVDTKLLYRLPELLAAPAVKPVVWVEGEKSADRLASLGMLTTTLGGASKDPSKAVKALKGRRVVILPDNDEPGRKHAETVAKCLKASGCQSVRILQLPGLAVKGDVVDWLDSGNSIEQLQALVRRASGHTSAASLAVNTPEWMWQPRIPAQGLTLIFGEAGLGKSTLVLDLVARWTRGDAMPGSVGSFSPITVAMYGFEDDVRSVVLPRLIAAGANLERVEFLEPDPTKPILPDQVKYLRQLCDEVEAKILILDNIENGMGSGVDANASRSLRAALNPLADFGLPVIAIHHPKKGSMNLDPREAMTGSQAYTSVSRSTLMVVQTEDEDLIALTPVKNNMTPVRQTRTLYYKIVTREVDGCGQTPYIEWHGGDNATAQELQAAHRARFLETQRLAMGQTVGVNGGRPVVLGVEEKIEEILSELAEGEWMSARDLWLEAQLRVSPTTFQSRIADMIEEGRLLKQGKTRGTEYRLTTIPSHASSSSLIQEYKGFRAKSGQSVLTPDESTASPVENLSTIGSGEPNGEPYPEPNRVPLKFGQDQWLAIQRAKAISNGMFKGDEE